MVALLTDLKKQVAGSLIRQASVKTSKWAENYMVLGKPKPGRLSFYWHPWSKEMMDCDEDWVGRKAAQMAYSLNALARAIHANDIKKLDVLYLLPKRSPDAADFSKAKFDAILESSPHLNELYSNTRNIGHKQAGPVNLFIRGARSRSGLKSISVGLQIWDELDEMPRKMLALAIERSSGYEEADTQLIKISTPSVPDFGIDAEVKYTDQSVFVFRCPSCSRFTDLPFPNCLKITTDSLNDQEGLKKSYIFCPLCKNELKHVQKPLFLGLDKGSHWQPTQKGFATRGFCINQYYSTLIQPWRIAESFLKGEAGDGSEMQEYWNSKGGLPYLPQGARISDQDIQACKRTHSIKDTPPLGLITMGVDIGKKLHYWIDRWALPTNRGKDLNMFARAQCLTAGTVNSFEELAALMPQYQVVQCVLDWQPEERKVIEFCQRFYGHAWACYFHRGMIKKNIVKSEEEQKVGIGRTSWLDLSQSRFQIPRRTIELPKDLHEDVAKHLKALARIEKKDNDGNPVAKYISTGADHFAFARLYSEVALPLAVSAQEGQDISAFL